MGDLPVFLVGILIDGQAALVGVEGEVAGVVVGEVVGAVAVADDEELHEAEQRPGVAIAGIVLVLDDLLHRPARADAEGLQLDLHAGHAVDEEDHIVTVVAVVRVDAELVDDLEGVFAPVLDVDEGVIQRRAVIAGETADGPQGLRGGEDIWGDDLVEQAGELGVGEADAVEGFEFLAEVFLQRGAVGDVWAVIVFQALELADEALFDVFLTKHRIGSMGKIVCEMGRRHGKYNLNRLRIVFFFSILRISHFLARAFTTEQTAQGKEIFGGNGCVGRRSGSRNRWGWGVLLETSIFLVRQCLGCLKIYYPQASGSLADCFYRTVRQPSDWRTAFTLQGDSRVAGTLLLRWI